MRCALRKPVLVTGVHREGIKMWDLLLILATIGFFLLAIAYTVACDKLK